MAKYVAPVWENKVAPCGGLNGCPAQTDIAASLHALSIGDANRAWRIMMESHPLRATLGRVCYAFCEKPCNRGHYDTPISIQALEAVIGDTGFDPDWRPELAKRNGKKVGIIGAGPAGLAAGWYLNIAGYDVVVHEAEKEAGGVLRYGIPSYRLPKDVLAREIKLIKDSGITIKTDSRVDGKNLQKLAKSEKYDAVIVSIGAGVGRKSGIEGEENCQSGLDLLKRINTEETHNRTFDNKNVYVIGGGNVAMDACRSAVRLGAKSVAIIYRRTEKAMPAHDFEVRHSREEGVEYQFLQSPVSFDGKILTVEVMRLGAPDDSGRRGPEPTGETIAYEADEVIMAIGQETSIFDCKPQDNIFYAGDVIPTSEGTVIHAIAAGKKAASKAAKFLTTVPISQLLGPEVPYEQMNVRRYFEPRMRLRSFIEPAAIRKENFDSVEQVVSFEEGKLEAARCFRCGMCVGGVNSDCDWCFKACPTDGVNKLMVEWDHKSTLFEMSENCDVCGKCWGDCPRYVVTPVEMDENE